MPVTLSPYLPEDMTRAEYEYRQTNRQILELNRITNKAGELVIKTPTGKRVYTDTLRGIKQIVTIQFTPIQGNKINRHYSFNKPNSSTHFL